MTRRRALALLVAATLAATGGCHSVDVYRYTGYDHNATMVVYRLSSLTLAAAPVYVVLDGNIVAELRQDDYVVIQLVPGRHELGLKADMYPRSDDVIVEARDLDWFYYKAEPNSSIATLATASVVDPTLIGTAVAAMFVKPFLLRASSDAQFRAQVDGLERIETVRDGSPTAVAP